MEGKIDNKSKTITIIFAILGLILIGLGGYKLLTDREGGNSTPTPTATPNVTVTPEPKNEISNKLTANTTFKSKEGKSSFIVNDIKEIGDDEESWTEAYVTFDDKSYTFKIDDEDYRYDKYLRLSGDPDSGSRGQCYSTAILLDLETNTIEKSNTTDQRFYDVIKSNDGYFFTEGYCLSGYDITVYDNNWKKLGRLVGSTVDEDGNIYSFTNGKIIKYNSSGNTISESSTEAVYTGPGLIYNNTLYYLSTEKDATYLINNDTNEKYKVSDMKSEDYDSYTGLDADYIIRLDLNGDKISIKFEFEEKYIYDINSKTLTATK